MPKGASGKLTEDKVKAIRELYQTGHISLRELADRHGVSSMMTSYSVRGKRHADAPGPNLGQDYWFQRGSRQEEQVS